MLGGYIQKFKDRPAGGQAAGEKMVYRLLFSNTMEEFMPQFKLHLMCNMPPQVDGGDQGVQRRMRMLTYEARFVALAEANPEVHRYVAGPKFLDAVKGDCAVRMEFLRYLLDHFDMGSDYNMPDLVRQNSAVYLAENDKILQFVNTHIEAAPPILVEGVKEETITFFTLNDARRMFEASRFANDTKLPTLELELQRHLNTPCLADKGMYGAKHKTVFMNWRLITDDIYTKMLATTNTVLREIVDLDLMMILLLVCKDLASEVLQHCL